MFEGSTKCSEDNDSLHILPLSIIPLQTKGLREAKLIKNSRLEGMIELFSDDTAGSGQVTPAGLSRVFQFEGDNAIDLEIVQKLSRLSSYDIYSLRIELRRLGIEVDEVTALKLSDDQMGNLTVYMQTFIRPLISAIYGNEVKNVSSFDDLVNLLSSSDIVVARNNLQRISGALHIDLEGVPEFLRNYGDVYLSLAYYQYCHDLIKPSLAGFCDTLTAIQSDTCLQGNATLMVVCKAVSDKLQGVSMEVGSVLDMFGARTEAMWEDISGQQFNAMDMMIKEFQTKIGGALCALTVKMNAWTEMFPDQGTWGLAKRADFIMSDMRQGMERIEEIGCMHAASTVR